MRWAVWCHPAWWSYNIEDMPLVGDPDQFVRISRHWTKAGAQSKALRLNDASHTQGARVRFAALPARKGPRW